MLRCKNQGQLIWSKGLKPKDSSHDWATAGEKDKKVKGDHFFVNCDNWVKNSGEPQKGCENEKVMIILVTVLEKHFYHVLYYSMS